MTKTKDRVRRRIVDKLWLNNNPWLRSYYSLKQRCNDKNHNRYKYYGERGIKSLITKDEIKSLWFRDEAWKLKRPSIDRKDNDGNYEYSNCRFIELSKNCSKPLVDGKRQCTICKKFKTLDNFRMHKDGKYPRSNCKTCHS